MSTPTIRAALQRLVELSKRHAVASVWDDAIAGARAALAAEPVGEGPSERIVSIAKAVQECAHTWEPDALLIGNVCAEDVAEIADAAIEAMRPATPAAPEAGEVAELVARLRDWHSIPLLQERERIAALLQQLSAPAPPAPEVVSDPYKLPEPGEVGELVAELRHFVAEYNKMRGLDPECIYSIQEGIEGREAHLRVSQLTRVATLLQQRSAPAPAVVPVPVAERMPAPSTDQGPRQTLMNFRATPDERQQLQALAVAHGTTVSDLIRRGLQLQGFEPQR